MTARPRRIEEPEFRPPYPSAAEVLRRPETYDPDFWGNRTARHLRELVGSDLPVATPIDSDQIWDWWTSWFTDRIMSKRDTVCIVTGSPGEGKSTFALALASRVRDRLGRELGTTRTLDLEKDVVYRLSHLVARVNESSRDDPSVVLGDEACLIGAQSGAGLTDIGRLLDRVLSVSRINGVTLFLLHPSIWGVSAMVRLRRAACWAHVERRGLTTMFVLKDTLEFTPPRQLPFKKMRRPFSKLTWDSLEDDPIWAPYEALKLATVRKTLVDSVMEADKYERRAGLRPSGPWSMDWSRAGDGGAPQGSRVCVEPGCGRPASGRSPRCNKCRRERDQKQAHDRFARFKTKRQEPGSPSSVSTVR